MPPGQPLSLRFQFPNFLAKLYINIYHIKTKLQNNPFSGSREIAQKKCWRFFGHARGPALESDNWNFETLLHNFTSISTLSSIFRTIGTVVTKNSSGQNLAERNRSRRKGRRRRIRRNGAKTMIFPTSFGRLKKKRSKNNQSPLLVWEA